MTEKDADRFIALFNIGLGHVLEEELVERARMECLEEELKTAVEHHDFKSIKRIERAIRAELKRQGQGPLTYLERHVLIIYDFLHYRNGHPPTVSEIHRRFCQEYPNLQHDLKAVRRVCDRLGLDVRRGSPGRPSK
jgi:hypothetical protein